MIVRSTIEYLGGGKIRITTVETAKERKQQNATPFQKCAHALQALIEPRPVFPSYITKIDIVLHACRSKPNFFGFISSNLFRFNLTENNFSSQPITGTLNDVFEVREPDDARLWSNLRVSTSQPVSQASLDNRMPRVSEKPPTILGQSNRFHGDSQACFRVRNSKAPKLLPTPGPKSPQAPRPVAGARSIVVPEAAV